MTGLSSLSSLLLLLLVTPADTQSAATLNHESSHTTHDVTSTSHVSKENIIPHSTTTNAHVDEGTSSTTETQNTEYINTTTPGKHNYSSVMSMHPSIFSTLHSSYTDSTNSSSPSISINGTHNQQGPQTSNGLSDNPGLVAVICIFVSILCIAVVVVAVKTCQKKEPEFEKLDDVPMNGINEEAPFARYPPK